MNAYPQSRRDPSDAPFPLPPTDPQASRGSKTGSRSPGPPLGFRQISFGSSRAMRGGWVGRWLPQPGSPPQPNMPSERHREQFQFAKRGSLWPGWCRLDRGSGHFPPVVAPSPEGLAARLAPPTGLPRAHARAARKLTETRAAKRRAKFPLISYEWGESVCRTHC